MPRPRVALATWSQRRPHADDENARLLAALAAEGVDARLVVWTEGPLDTDAFDLLVVRTPWDYFADREGFLAWAEAAERRVPVWNPPAVLRWNSEKTYLAELQANGVPIPPTAFLRRGEPSDLEAVLAREGWREVVVKPTVDGGAARARRVEGGDPAGAAHLAAILAEGDAMVQPFLPSIREGERALVFLDGAFSHAVVKRPAEGDWRVQPQWGGTSARIEPTKEEMAVARRALAACPGPTLYARVDLVRLPDETSALMELEVFEPFLFLADAPGAAERYARAIAAKARGA